MLAPTRRRGKRPQAQTAAPAETRQLQTATAVISSGSKLVGDEDENFDEVDDRPIVWGGTAADIFASQNPDLADRVDIAATQIQEGYRYIALHGNGCGDSDDDLDGHEEDLIVNTAPRSGRRDPLDNTLVPNPTPSTPVLPRKKPLYPIFLRTTVPRFQSPLNDSVPMEEARSKKQKIHLDQGLFALMSHTLRTELALYATIKDVSVEQLSELGYLIMMETHPDVIKTAITGGWQRTFCNDSSLKRTLDKLFDRATAQKHPIIYVNEWCNRKGESPTPNQLLAIAEVAEAYYRGSDPGMARKIDSFCKPFPSGPDALDPSFRKYVWNKDKHRISKTRTTWGLAFCRNLRKRLSLLPIEMMDVPLHVPLVELGVTADVITRLRQHAEHINSNPIMNLFDAIGGLKWKGEYGLCQFVVHSCCGPDRVALAEILFTHLCEGYISNAGGFSTHPAGQSVVAAYNQKHTGWEEAGDWAMRNMRCAETHEAEKKFWENRLSEGGVIPDDALVEVREDQSRFKEKLACYTDVQLQEMTARLREQAAETRLSLTKEYEDDIKRMRIARDAIVRKKRVVDDGGEEENTVS